jgi:hypothetical protein
MKLTILIVWLDKHVLIVTMDSKFYTNILSIYILVSLAK